MRQAVRDELSRLWSIPAALFLLAFLAYPTVLGVAMMRSYAYQAPIDMFTLMTNTPVALVFPLLLTALYVFRFSGLLHNRFAFYSRFRSSTRTFLAVHLTLNVVLVGVLVFTSYLIAGLVSFVVLPATGILATQTGYQPLPAGEVAHYTSHLVTFSQLADAGTGIYVVVFAGFVGLFSVVMATAALGFTLLAKSRILGLAATLILYTVEDFVLSYAGLEQFRSSASLFPDSIIQQPLWVPMIPLAGWLVLSVVLIVRVGHSADQLETLA